MVIENKGLAVEPCNQVSCLEIPGNDSNGGNGNTGAIVMDSQTLQMIISGTIQGVMNNLITNDLSPLNEKKRMQESIKVNCQ